MDIFVRNVPAHSSDDDLTTFFKPHLATVGIHAFLLQKPKWKPFAFLTIGDATAARAFLKATSSNRLAYLNHSLNITKSRNEPNEFKVKSVQLGEKKHLEKQKVAQPISKKSPRQNSFEFTSLSHGFWTYRNGATVLTLCHIQRCSGNLVFGRPGMSFFIAPSDPSMPSLRMDVGYYSVETICLGQRADPTVTFDLNEAPRFYEMSDQLLGMLMKTDKTRLPSLIPRQKSTKGTCFVYQVKLQNGSDLAIINSFLHHQRGMPPSISRPLGSRSADHEFKDFVRFDQELLRYSTLPFSVQFQMQKLINNGILPPDLTAKLLPTAMETYNSHGEVHTVQALRRLSVDIPFLNPQADAELFEIDALSRMLKEEAQKFQVTGSIYDLTSEHDHIVLVHRALLTPSCLILNGPEPEVSNRVLRKYPDHIDAFVRVTFGDEDGEPLRFEPRTDLDKIYQGRFKKALNEGIKIGGRIYTFLGFSHSSLRSQSCWFMAPFFHNQELVYSTQVIKGLGDFSQIRSPAKCAARIGQAFSDTTGAITVTAGAVKTIPDVERNNRVFSDGCGTISRALIDKIWREYSYGRGLRPTTIQIRFGGSKGIVSLDPRLDGEMLCLRPSMMKFPSNDRTIEICGAAFKSLPCYLNRQFIKILEDLDVPSQIFLELQEEAVDALREVIASPLNASKFLEMNRVASSAGTPSFIKMLHYIDVSYLEDSFLRGVVEHAALNQLRELKHRQRIPVEHGVTLYGIMDETGVLQENEIHVILEKRNGRRKVLSGGNVVITKAPAYHPGDVRVVKAVDVPADSPINELRNCVVFSCHGERDLPSKMSGADLDGDMFQIFYDHRLMPRKMYQPADYPRVPAKDIGREVEKEDMIDFFIEFMKTDQLGRISVIHQQLADQKPMGTDDPDCRLLAELASTAVDFSKTGIPVDLTKIPIHNKMRPDFMANGSRYTVDAKGPSVEQDDDSDDEDLLTKLDPGFKPYQYYESQKALGQLYRAIDERKFFQLMRSRINEQLPTTQRPPVMTRLWNFVEREATGFQWKHHLDEARKLRENYERHVIDLIYSADYVHEQVKEIEVFCGIVLGRSRGGQTRRQREAQTQLKERFNETASYFSAQIKNVEPDELLPMSMACLYIGVFEEPRLRGRRKLVSWQYIAGAICLNEVRKLQGGLLSLSRFGRLSIS